MTQETAIPEVKEKIFGSLSTPFTVIFKQKQYYLELNQLQYLIRE
jgi:hypothetical protein